jgi:hypothetical protein
MHPVVATHAFFQKTAKVGRMLDEAMVLVKGPATGKHAVFNAADGTPLATGTALSVLDGTVLYNGSAVVITTLARAEVQDRLDLYHAALKR